jgi:oligopeptide transport system substrate-binding protein
MMKFSKVVGAGLVIAASAFLLVACGSGSSSSSSSSSDSQTFRRMESDTLQTMDPSTNTDAISGQALIDTMDGFYRYNGKKLQPAIATSIAKPTNDGKTYTIKLRKNAKWSNGDPVTAQDFVYGWQRTVNPKTAAQYAYLFDSVENAKDIIAGKKAPDTLGIKATDKNTIQITLTEAVPYFNGLMTNPAFFPQNQKFVEKAGKNYGTQAKYALGNGPFVLKGWTGTNNSWSETKNKNYWNAKAVKLDKVAVQVIKDPSTALNLFQSNKIDDVALSGESAQQMKNDPAFTPRKQSTTFYTQLNQKTIPAFKNTKIRQAISMAVNRKELINKVLGNGSLIANNVTPQGIMSNPSTGQDFAKAAATKDSEYTAYNPKKAKQLFQEGLQEVGIKELDVTLLGDDTDGGKKMNEYLQSTWQQNLPGMKVTLSNVPFKTRLTRSTNGQFDMVTSAWGADYPDAISFLDLFTTGNSYNNGSWSNSDYDAKIAASKTTDVLDPQKRWNDLQDAQQIITQEQGVVPLYQRVEAHLVNKKVKNLQYSPANNYNFVTAYIK